MGDKPKGRPKDVPPGQVRSPRRGSAAPAARSYTCPIVGVGASAGGLEAFTRLLRALPAHTGLAFVLVQHLDPAHESMLAEILGRESKMPVVEAAGGMRVEPDHVYVIPPAVSIGLSDGSIKLTARKKPPAQSLPIDKFFGSLADECADRSIAVILSGTGSDGTAGLGAIKAAGGITFAQDPTTADYDGMPRAAIDAGSVDSVLDPERIAAELVRVGRHLEVPTHGKRSEAVDHDSLGKILSIVRGATGLDLSHYRETTLVRRISRRMLLEGVTSMEEYLHLLQGSPTQVELFYRDVLVNMTEFFRDPKALDALTREVFPDVLGRKGPDSPFRIWVPGCSRGQEAYSIVISLIEYLQGQTSRPEIQVFATDVNEQDIRVARAGVYPASIAAEVSPERLSRFFLQVPGGYQVDRSIREMCVFAVHDITKDPPFSRLDLISFRNVLIYMERELQQRVLRTMHYALAEDGFLLLGPAETTGSESALFSVVDKKHLLYRRQPGPARLLPALAPSAGAIGFAGKAQAAEPVRGFDVLQEAEKIVLDHHQPAGVLVNVDLEVLQFRGRVAPYLDPTEGTPEMRLPRLMLPGIASAAEAAIREAGRSGTTARRHGSSPLADGTRREVDLEVVPIPAPTGESYFLILLSETPGSQRTAAMPAAPDSAIAPTAADVAVLRDELAEARERLDAIITEKDSTYQGLRATSEQLQSSNEELRTINEEFQTAQEELQSTNEELTTLNDELRDRNVELGRLTDDLNNVIDGVEIPILILGPDLDIRRFTPHLESIVNIVSADIGRPITDLSLKAEIPDFALRVRQVLEQLEPFEAEARTAEGHWYSVRIRPYKTGQGTTDGVVVAFLDIDLLKAATQRAELARDHANAIVSTIREPLLTLDADLRVREANDAYFETFAATAEDTVGAPIYELGNGQWDFAQLRELLEAVLPGDHEFAGLEVRRDFPALGSRTMVLNARRVREDSGEPSILLAINDITDLRRQQSLNAALNDISLTVSSTLEFDDLLERVLRDSTEAVGAESSVILVKRDNAWAVQEVYGLPAELVGRVLANERIPATRLAARSGQPRTFENMLNDERFADSISTEYGLNSALIVPLLLRGETIGALSFYHDSPAEHFTDVEVDFGRRLGTVLSLSNENANLYSAQREIANTLQSALLTVLEDIPHIECGTLYRSATKAARVGGDFYDLFALDDGRTAVLIGDVSGKGVEAATLTALVKNTIRALVSEDNSPAEAVSKTSELVRRATGPATFCTLVLCILDTATGQLTYCSAGHTRSIVKRGDGEVELLDVGSPLVGAFEAQDFIEGETTVDSSDVLLLYTDGVTEARCDGSLFGEERLVEFVQNLPPTRPGNMPDIVFDEIVRFTGGTLNDDVAIVAVAIKSE